MYDFFAATLSPPLMRVKSSARSDAQWSSVEQSGVGLSQFATAKVLLFFDICKKKVMQYRFSLIFSHLQTPYKGQVRVM